MFFREFYVEGLAAMSYMVGNRSPGEVAVIDPIRDVDLYLETARQEGVNITHIFETHIHADFVSGSRELAEKTGAKIYLSSHGGKDWQYEFGHVPMTEGMELYLGQYKIKVIHTPGHTPEHVILTLTDTSRSEEPWMAFTGDFLFVGDIGRPDLLGDRFSEELAEKLYDSIHTKLLALPDWVEVYPAHGEGSLCGKNLGSKRSTTIGFERRFNYALKPMSKRDFVRAILEEQPPAPAYFRRMKKINKEGPRVLGALPRPAPMGPREVKKSLDEGALLIDTRSPEAFGGAHIKGAYSIPLDSSFPTWVGYVVPPDTPILLIIERKEDIEQIVRHLIRVGYDRIAGYLDGGVRAWLMEGYPIAEIPQISAGELRKRMAEDKGVVVLDVRTDSEWNSFRYPFALHMHAGQLQEKYRELGLKSETPIVVTCRSGHRGSIASSILEQKGFTNVSNLLGGMVAWQNSGGETCSKPGCPEYQEWGPWWHDAINQPKKVADDIFIGGQPSEADLSAIKAKGFKSIINLRASSEESILSPEDEKSKAGEMGFEYANIPVIEEVNSETVKSVFEKIKKLRENSGPVFIHCGGGRRAAAMAILYLTVESGLTLKDALEKAQEMGLNLEAEPRLKDLFQKYLKDR